MPTREISLTQQLFASAHEDVSRLSEILRAQQYTVVLRGADGILSGAPIYDVDGRVLASLDIAGGPMSPPESSASLLRALLESAARTITERWFRLIHCHRWIIAAESRHARGSSMMIAIDREQKLVGTDRQARQWLAARGLGVDGTLGLDALFQCKPTLLRRRSSGDEPITLLASRDGEPWIALVTPPHIGVIEPRHDARAWLHARPRLDLLAHLRTVASEGREQRGLSRVALQRVEEYIDAHLDATLDVQELAAIVRMSPSHFTRCFYKSVGLTPHRYVVQCRVLRARELLATTDLPLTEIALSSGFADQSHFSRRFHELVGVSPGAFRCA